MAKQYKKNALQFCNFGFIIALSQVCQLATLTPFIAVATILSGVRKSLKRSQIDGSSC